jgi:hypothetical protein
LGQLEALPPPWPNAGYLFTNPTFAGPHSSYRIAPQAAITPLAPTELDPNPSFIADIA